MNISQQQITKQIFKDRNHFYIRIGKGYVVPLLLVLHDHNRFTDIQFHELITVLQSIIKNNFKSSGELSSTFLTNEQSATSKPLYLSDLGFTFRFAPTYPRYSIFIKNPIPPQHNNDNIKMKRKETIYIDDDDNDKGSSEEEEEEEEEYYDVDEQVNKKNKKVSKRKKKKSTTTTTLKPSYNCEVIETRFDREEREKKEKENEKEQEEDMGVLNDRAIAKAFQDDLNGDVIEIKGEEEGGNISQSSTSSSQTEVYQGGIYKGLIVTGKTIIIETQTKVAGANVLPLNSFHNQLSTSAGGDNDSDEFDEFNLPDRQSQSSTTSSKSKSSRPTSSSSSSSTNVKKKSTRKSKSKSTISTNNYTNISTYFNK